MPGTSGSNTFALKGVLAALVTPFTEALEIDYTALKKQLEVQLSWQPCATGVPALRQLQYLMALVEFYRSDAGLGVV